MKDICVDVLEIHRSSQSVRIVPIMFIIIIIIIFFESQGCVNFFQSL